MRIANMTPQEVKTTVRDALDQTRGKRFMIGSGCTMSTHTPDENLMAIKEALLEGG
jgi:uroporphyrinogen-III decarboxylase